MKKIGLKKLLLALMLLPTFVTAGTVLNECNTSSECGILGLSYANGTGVKQDDFKAVALFQKACGLNSGLGCTFLRALYEDGRGIKQSSIKALEYYGKACDLKDKFGCQMYAELKRKMGV
ncbi:hypothetical protein [uncultured Gammaproteobacteria bacterium]|nr:hypothetical protein [uncultured Gammaproteobacteria bacterium]